MCNQMRASVLCSWPAPCSRADAEIQSASQCSTSRAHAELMLTQYNNKCISLWPGAHKNTFVLAREQGVVMPQYTHTVNVLTVYTHMHMYVYTTCSMRCPTNGFSLRGSHLPRSPHLSALTLIFFWCTRRPQQPSRTLTEPQPRTDRMVLKIDMKWPGDGDSWQFERDEQKLVS